jgi:hypothetical protein
MSPIPTTPKQINMYTKYIKKGNFRFVQQMDLSTDTAIYRDLEDNILMKVDSSGKCYDRDDKPFGKFGMNYGGDNYTWFYESEDYHVIQTGCIQLFDQAEPFVIAKLFGD